MMQFNTKILNSVDLSEIVYLQKTAFSTNNSYFNLENLQTLDYYKWKYSIWSNKTIISEARDSGNLIGMVAAFSCEIQENSKIQSAWQISDIAVMPDFRGRGIFTEIIFNLRSNINRRDFIYVFPNKSSKSILSKLGWSIIGELSYIANYAKESPYTKKITQVTLFDSKIDELFMHTKDLNFSTTVLRSYQYLNRRYCSALHNHYNSFILTEGQNIRGYVILRKISLYGIEFCLVMDIFCTSYEDIRELSSFVSTWSKKNKLKFYLYLTSNSEQMSHLKKISYHLPNLITPRRFFCMSDLADIKERDCNQSKYNFVTGDWDGF